MEKVPMTAAGHQALESELKRAVERPRIIELIVEARGNDDLSENAEYHAAKEAHDLNEELIAELEDTLSRAEVADVSRLIGSKTIKFGATVTLIDEDTEEKKTYQIVGDHEADVKHGKISISSPLARALANWKVSQRHGRGPCTGRRAVLQDQASEIRLRHAPGPARSLA
jgi:transcription elongation factor GreA